MTKEEFKELRLKLNLTQQQLANYLHKTERQIRNYELGKHPVPYLVEKSIQEHYQKENT